MKACDGGSDWQLARRSGYPDQIRRLLAVALILNGGSRSEASRVVDVTLQIVRDWVLRFNEGGPDRLATHRAPGRAAILNYEQRAQLAAVVEAGSIPAAHRVVRWWLAYLAHWVWDEFALTLLMRLPLQPRDHLFDVQCPTSASSNQPRYSSA
jgi:transposase